MFLDEKDGDITIKWMSYGGEWTSGMALYDLIKSLKSHVTMECYGRERSMGTVILQACDERVLTPNCTFMIHYGTDVIEEKHSQDVQMDAKESARINTLMEQIYLEKIREKKPRYRLERLQDLIKYDKYLLPQEAIDIGLADKIAN